MFFDERIFKITTLAVESFGRLERNGEELLENKVNTEVGRKEGEGKTRKGVLMECTNQVMSLKAYVAISRWVRRYRLAGRRREEGRTVNNHREGTLHPGP